MTDPDRYAGGCYGWGQHDVPVLAGFLDEDLSTSWAQVSAWWQAHDVTAAHLEVLRDARERIVEIWPPSVSRASAAYVEQLDALIASMGNMVAAAASNAAALAGILTVLESARRRVDDLHVRWERASPSWVVKASRWATPLGPLLQQDDERARLNAQAAQVMTETDNSVYAYMPHLIVVPHRQSTGVDDLPPSGPTQSGGGSGRGGARRIPSIPPASPPTVVDPGSVSQGPVLSGSLASQPGASDASIGNNQPMEEPFPGSQSGSANQVSPWLETPAGRALRSGAVLGSPAGSVTGTDIKTRGASEPSEGSPSERPPGSPGTGAGFLGGPVGSGVAAGRRRQRSLPPDTEWSVPQGVPPVLEPGPEPVHDPGPGVIGIDR